MRKVKYKDKNREFEMTDKTFSEVFKSPEVMLALLDNEPKKKVLCRFFEYVKSLSIVVKFHNWLSVI